MSKKLVFSASVATVYQTMFDSMIIRSQYLSTVKAVVERIKKNRIRYENVASALNCPWFMVGIIHYLEGDLNFNTHLFNGDPLTARTVNVPAGLPRTGEPPFKWEESATLALGYKGIRNIPNSNIPEILYLFESYNGFGYRYLAKPINTPYLWSFSTYYLSGKFTRDHIYDANVVSSEVGAAPLLKVLLNKEDVNVDNGQNANYIDTIEKPATPPPDFTTYQNDVEQSVQSFLDLHGIKMSPAELIAYKNNSNSIFKSYNGEQEFLYRKASEKFIGIGARIQVPFNKIQSRSVYVVNQTLVQNKPYDTFIETEIGKLLNNPKYVRYNINETVLSPESAVFKRQEKFSVWLWSKALSPDGSRIFDLSPFCENVNITTTKDGSNWTINLPHITYKRNVDGGFIIDADRYSLKNFDVNFATKNSLSHKENYELFEDTTTLDDNNEIKNSIVEGYSKKNDSLFIDLIQSNDVIFIRLETLAIEDRVSELALRDENFTLPSDILSGNVFDLIGLVDQNPMSINGENSDQTINVSGRCLSKLLIDDGVYWFPVEYLVKDREKIIKNSSKTKSSNRLILPENPVNDKGVQKNFRFLGDGAIIGDTQFNFNKVQTIEEWVVFILSQLSNIAIAPDTLFNSYPDKTFIITRDGDINENKPTTIKRVLATGIFQIVKLAIDQQVGDRKTVDNSLTTDTGSLMNLVQKVCQKPFIDLYMDTYGDKFYFIIRKPPFTYDSFKSNFCINIFHEDIISDTLAYATDEVYSWYKINPFVNVFGYDENSGFMSIFPAVLFPEYVEIWGSKVLEISSNFIDFDSSESSDTTNNFENIRKQAYEDLDWVIETNAYLPFTRKGTITIKPDRRIKRGINIRNFSTGEIFFVEAVQQQRTNGYRSDGSTTLTVSHGMQEKHLEKYFNIINLRKNKNVKQEKIWTVNQEIFKFFLSRQK